ncbi:hypothetical protein [Streptomyces sp. NPDC001422]|uniref:hypothetical protein n=1 Tax=Streptomyces sp. NPDC001422 TaxID=3364575 RepID=UPI0036B67F8B
MTDQDDIAALRQEGDLHVYMRSLIRPTRTPATAKPRRDRRTWGAVPIPPDHKPGAWPPGTSPPGPEHQPGPDWDDAVTHYRTQAHDTEEPDE